MSQKRNVGEVFRRKGTKRFSVRYYDANGRRRLEATGTEDKAEAERILRDRLTAKDKGIAPDAAIGKITLAEAAADVETDYTINKKRSVKDVARKFRLHVRPYFGDRRKLSTISTADIRAFVKERQREEKTADGKLTKRAASNAEINRELAALRRAFNLAVQAGKLIHRPHIPMLRENNTRRGFFERDQFDAVCAKLPEDLRPVVSFAFETGWRIASEVLPIEWRQVDWNGRVIRLDVGTTKSGEGRTYPFTAAIEKILVAQLAEHDRRKKQKQIVNCVFHRDGEPIKVLRKAWVKACKDAGYPGMLMHDMRRSAVRTLERAGVPRSVSMSLVGHKTESIYRRYAIVDEAMQREAAARLDTWAARPQTTTPTGTVHPFPAAVAK